MNRPHPGITFLAVALMSLDTRKANMKRVASNRSMPQKIVRHDLLELGSGLSNDKDIIIRPPFRLGERSISFIGRIITCIFAFRLGHRLNFVFASSEKSIVCNRATRVYLQTLQTIISTRSVIQTFLKCRKCVTHRHFSVYCQTNSVYVDY